MKTYSSIFDFVKRNEVAMSQPITISDGWEWNFKTHVKETVLYSNSQLIDGKNKGALDEKPVKNIIRPILNLQKRTEGFDVKDIELFVDDAENYYKSFLVKKFHTKWAREHEIDTFIDEMVESYIDFGGALVKKVNDVKPEVVPMQSIAFCDQTDMLSGPLAIKHFFAPHELKEMEKAGWGRESNGATITIDELITLSEDKKVPDRTDGQQNQTPGAYIELYEVHGSLPNSFLDIDDPDDEYSLQMHVIGFYTDSTGQKQGVSLFSKKESELPFKLILRDKIYGRALGLGGAEELFEAQVWVNYGAIRIKEMLDSAAKIVYKTTDPNVANRNKMDDVENGEILEVAQGLDIGQLDTTPRNAPVFDRYIQDWEAYAQKMGAATDPLLGETPPSGTPFRLQERLVIEGKGIHEYRKGKLAIFLDSIYRDWVLPHIVKEISKGQEFLAELDLEELNEIRDRIVENQANTLIKELILDGQLVLPEQVEAFKQRARDEFSKGGSKRFIKILKDELKDVPVSVRMNIAGKQAYLSEMVDKLTNVFRQIFNPQVLQTLQTNPGALKPFNEILEKSGLSPIIFSSLLNLGNRLPQSTQPQLPVPTRSPELVPTI